MADHLKAQAELSACRLGCSWPGRWPWRAAMRGRPELPERGSWEKGEPWLLTVDSSIQGAMRGRNLGTCAV